LPNTALYFLTCSSGVSTRSLEKSIFMFIF
jgi:hypothetical protein